MPSLELINRSSNDYDPVPRLDEDDDLDPFELNDNDSDIIEFSAVKKSLSNNSYNPRSKTLQKLCCPWRKSKAINNSQRSPKNGRCGTIFLLLNTMIGSGILNQPQVFSESGLLGGAGLYLLCCATIWVAQQKLLQAGLITGIMDYGKLAHHCYGPAGSLALNGMMVIGGFLSQCSYLTVIGGESVAVLKTLKVWFGHDIQEITELHVLPVITGLIVLPLCLTRHFGHLACVSVISIVSMTLVICCVMFAGPAEGKMQGYSDDDLILFRVSGSVQKVGAMLLAVNSMPATFFAYESMDIRSPERWKCVTLTSIIIGAAMCLTTGVGGYLSFRSGTDGDILDKFTGAAVFTAVKLMVVFHLILYLPNSFLVARHSFTSQFLNLDVLKMSTVPFTILTILLLGGPFFVVMMLFSFNMSEGDAFGYILDVTGALCVGCIALTLPGLIYLKVIWRSEKLYSRVGIYFLLFGLTLNVLVPTVEVLERMEEHR